MHICVVSSNANVKPQKHFSRLQNRSRDFWHLAGTSEYHKFTNSEFVLFIWGYFQVSPICTRIFVIRFRTPNICT